MAKYLRRLQAGAYRDDIALTGVAELLSVAIHVTKTNTLLHIDTGWQLPISSLPFSVNSVTCYWNPNKMTCLPPLALKCHLLYHPTQALTQVVFSATLIVPALNKSNQMLNVSFHLHYMYMCIYVQTCTTARGGALNGICLHIT